MELLGTATTRGAGFVPAAMGTSLDLRRSLILKSHSLIRDSARAQVLKSRDSRGGCDRHQDRFVQNRHLEQDAP